MDDKKKKKSDYTVVNGVICESFNLRNYIFQSARKCEMTSFSLTSLHVDLNEAAKLLLYHSYC